MMDNHVYRFYLILPPYRSKILKVSKETLLFLIDDVHVFVCGFMACFGVDIITILIGQLSSRQ